jgi:hypothetical protein
MHLKDSPRVKNQVGFQQNSTRLIGFDFKPTHARHLPLIITARV